VSLEFSDVNKAITLKPVPEDVTRTSSCRCSWIDTAGFMGVERLRFFNFRNLKDRDLDLGAREVFLVGETARAQDQPACGGPPLCLGSSFERAGIDTGARSAVRDRASRPLRERRARQKDAVSPDGPGRRKELRVNDKILADRRGCLSEVLCVCFVQKDMDFVIGPPRTARMFFFDQTLVLSDPSFLVPCGLRQVLRSRNLCLKGAQGCIA